MGRRSIKTTKAGKFMNPTDQFRKEQRRRELKKNKKQRQIVREAVLRMKDVGQMLQEIEEIEREELENLGGQPQHNEKGLDEKKTKLHASIHRVSRYYQQEDPKKAQELKHLIMESEHRRREMSQVYNSYRTARSQYAVEDIPMPDSMEGGLAYIPMPAAPSLSEEYQAFPQGVPGPQVPPPPPPGSPPPDVVEYNVIETPVSKSVRFMDVAPDIREPSPGDSSEDEKEGMGELEEDDEDNESSDDEDEDLEENVKDKGKGLEDDEKSQLAPPGPPGNHPPSLTSLLPPAPPPLFPQTFPPRYGFPPRPPVGPPPRYEGPPPRPLMPPQIQSGAVLSAPPTRFQQEKTTGVSSSTGGDGRSAIISAQPQLRNMTAEVTKFMPTSLRVRRDQPKSAKPKLKVNQEVSHQPISGRTQPATAGMHVQGDAYDTFMHEMQGLL